MVSSYLLDSLCHQPRQPGLVVSVIIPPSFFRLPRMADPLSITGIVLAAGGAIKSLVNYCSDIRDVGTEIRSLRNELLAELLALHIR